MYLTNFTDKKKFLTSTVNLPLYKLCLFPIVLMFCTLKKTFCLHLLHTIQLGEKHTGQSLVNLILLRLNNATYLSLSSPVMYT